MRNHQNYRQILLPKIQTVLTERRVLQQNPKPLHLQKDAIEEPTNFKLDIPTARLKKGINIFEKSSYFLQVRPSEGKNKQNLNKKDDSPLFVPTRYYQLKKEIEIDEIFIKRNQVNGWSRKIALCSHKESLQKVRKVQTGRNVLVSKTQQMKLGREQLSGWQNIDDNLIQKIIMNS